MRALLILAAFWSAAPVIRSEIPVIRYNALDSSYAVRLETTKGAIVVAVHDDWAPRGAARFRELVTARYYDDSRFFRVVEGQWAQFGIAGDPKLATAWRTRTFADDPRRQSNTRGRV